MPFFGPLDHFGAIPPTPKLKEERRKFDNKRQQQKPLQRRPSEHFTPRTEQRHEHSPRQCNDPRTSTANQNGHQTNRPSTGLISPRQLSDQRTPTANQNGPIQRRSRLCRFLLTEPLIKRERRSELLDNVPGPSFSSAAPTVANIAATTGGLGAVIGETAKRQKAAEEKEKHSDALIQLKLVSFDKL
uniref:Uncharacterized protein n=1 Tax=Globodera pallida TaxID=36090 RepID=A0A183BLT9_GLOPA